jgi:23S rRNA pseudouridine1911/1915/1917 synthase
MRMTDAAPRFVAERQLEVPAGQRADRADKVLARLYPKWSRSRWQRMLAAGNVWRDDDVIGQTTRLLPGDVIQYTVPRPRPLGLVPVPMDLDVLFEDEELLVINKAPGVVVHPGAGTGDDTLVHGILHHCSGRLSGIGGVERPGIVHRLDKETSGILLVAKSDRCHQLLSAQFAERRIDKRYCALVHGVPAELSGSIDRPIGRDPAYRTRMCCRDDGRPARTDYTVERLWEGLGALVAVRIHSGRTHQVRVHMRAIGHPLLGDPLYAGRRTDPVAVPRVMLHATRIAFSYPSSSEAMVIECPPPADFSTAFEQLDQLAKQS